MQKLQSIMTDQHVEIEEEALKLISQFGEGSLRDAESLLDQILCTQDSPISVNFVSKVLGIFDRDLFLDLDEAFKNSDELTCWKNGALSEHRSSAPPRAQSLNDVTVDRHPQSREPDPADQRENDEPIRKLVEEQKRDDRSNRVLGRTA